MNGTEPGVVNVVDVQLFVEDNTLIGERVLGPELTGRQRGVDGRDDAGLR